MIAIIPIEPISDAHGLLIVAAFNRFFIDRGGWPDSDGDGVGYGNGDGDGRGDGKGYGNGRGDGNGLGWDHGFGDGNGNGDKCPEEWQAD